jgi:hypothetical protein
MDNPRIGAFEKLSSISRSSDSVRKSVDAVETIVISAGVYATRDVAEPYRYAASVGPVEL